MFATAHDISCTQAWKYATAIGLSLKLGKAFSSNPKVWSLSAPC